MRDENDLTEACAEKKALAGRALTTPPSPIEQREAGAEKPSIAGVRMTPPPAQAEREGRAASLMQSKPALTAPPDSVPRDRPAKAMLPAACHLTADPSLIAAIRLHYRLAKSAELSRIVIDQKLVSFARVFLTAWTPSGDEMTREKANKQAMRVIETIRDAETPREEDAALCEAMAKMVLAMEPSRAAFEAERKAQRKHAEKLAKTLPAWGRIEHVLGFGIWGLVTIIGEVGDVGLYPGCRHLYKRVGLAPDECYPRGEKSTGRMIPRAARGRIMGIIADPLLRQQWRGERDDAPAHAIGPFGKVYGETKARHLAAGKKPGHADKIARRAMVKALLHDVHRAWHGMALDYAK